MVLVPVYERKQQHENLPLTKEKIRRIKTYTVHQPRFQPPIFQLIGLLKLYGIDYRVIHDVRVVRMYVRMLCRIFFSPMQAS